MAAGGIAVPPQQHLAGASLELTLFGLGFEKHGYTIYAEGSFSVGKSFERQTMSG
jgi:hypothetical protein